LLRGCADGDGAAMAAAGLAVVEAFVLATRRGTAATKTPSQQATEAAAPASAPADEEDGSRDHRDIEDPDDFGGHVVGGRWVDDGSGPGGVEHGVVVLAAEFAMTVGRDKYCSPSHTMSFKLRSEGLNCVDAWALMLGL